MNSPYIHERRRIMDTAKKVKFCQLVRESQTIEHAAEWVDVSIRTVQRERKRDEDFDHEVRLALQATPDPLTLMENAARVHWRAAAWLLERTRPEQFARQPANTARDYQVEAALGMLLEAALAATAPAERLAFYEKVEPVCGQALQYCFPQLGPGGNLKKTRLPQTPLADETSRLAHREAIAAFQRQAEAATANGEQPAEWFTAPSLFGEPPTLAPQLSPKTTDATRSDATTSDTAMDDAKRSESSDAAPFRSPVTDPRSPTPQLSPKTHDATPIDTTPGEPASAVEEPATAVDYNLPIDFNLRYDDFAAAIGVLEQKQQDLLWDQRLRHHAALKRRNERQAAKREKSAKIRAQAQRRRAA